MKDFVVATARPLEPHLRETARVLNRATALARRGGVTLLAPGEPPPLTPGIHFVALPVAVGADLERAHATAADVLAAHLDAHPARGVHVFDVRLALPAVVRQMRGVRVVVEPGVTPSQRLRAAQPELAAERMIDLVALEDKVLARADAVIARSTVEAAALARRGVPDGALWTVYDGIIDPVAAPSSPDLPHLFAQHAGEPWEDWPGVLDACARLDGPWRLTVVGPQSALAVQARARALGVMNRVDSGDPDEPLGPRLAAAQALVSTLKDVHAVRSGGVLPESALTALAAGRPLVAPDLPAVRAYAGSAALYYPVGDTGALAARLGQVLGDATLRATLTGRALAQRARFEWARADDLLDDIWSALVG